jgi:hypothetical protein
MDGLSTAASIVAVLQLAGTVPNCLNSVRNAPKEREKVFGEISSITGVLFLMQTQAERAQQDQEGAGMLSTAVRSLSTPGGPLEQFKAALKTLASKFSPVGAVKKTRPDTRMAFREERDSRTPAVTGEVEILFYARSPI